MSIARRSIASAVLVMAGAMLVGCTAPDPDTTAPTGITAPPPTPVASGEPTAAAPEVESTLPAEIAGVDTTGWQQIVMPGGSATFRIPSDFEARQAPGGFTVHRADGEQQLVLSIDATGESLAEERRCLDAGGTAVAWRTAVLDRQDVQIAGAEGVAFGAAAVQLGGQWVMSMGLRPAADAQSPACPIVNGFIGGSSAVYFGSETVVNGAAQPWHVSSSGSAEEYLGDPEYATLRAILMSLELPQG